MGLDIDADRKAVLAGHCADYGIFEGLAGDVFRLIADDEERAKQVRVYGTLAPSDIRSAWGAVRGKLERAERQRLIGEYSHVEESEPRRVQILPLATRGKADNIRRLEAGTPDPGPPGSPENLASWKDYYGRPYVQDAQEKARKILARLNHDDEKPTPSPTTQT